MHVNAAAVFGAVNALNELLLLKAGEKTRDGRSVQPQSLRQLGGRLPIFGGETLEQGVLDRRHVILGEAFAEIP